MLTSNKGRVSATDANYKVQMGHTVCLGYYSDLDAAKRLANSLKVKVIIISTMHGNIVYRNW